MKGRGGGGEGVEREGTRRGDERDSECSKSFNNRAAKMKQDVFSPRPRFE